VYLSSCAVFWAARTDLVEKGRSWSFSRGGAEGGTHSPLGCCDASLRVHSSPEVNCVPVPRHRRAEPLAVALTPAVVSFEQLDDPFEYYDDILLWPDVDDKVLDERVSPLIAKVLVTRQHDQ